MGSIRWSGMERAYSSCYRPSSVGRGGYYGSVLGSGSSRRRAKHLRCGCRRGGGSTPSQNLEEAVKLMTALEGAVHRTPSIETDSKSVKGNRQRLDANADSVTTSLDCFWLCCAHG